MFPKNAGMDSFIDIGWRVGLVLVLLGSILFLVQKRTSNDSDEPNWAVDVNQDQVIEPTTRPLSAPTLDDFDKN